MGIHGLLQFIKDAGEPINIKTYRGQTVAVDTYCWLHKGAFSCAEKLAKGEPTDQYVSYCMKFVDLLLNFHVKPILVFDGRNLPSKSGVEKARRERRETNLQKGRQLLREGKLSEARDCFTRCVNITPAMAHNLIKAARARGVDCVVAPYEADAQLAYLTKAGLAQAVITEDSDLLAFSCKKVILKMDKQGNGLQIDQSNLGRCRSLGNVFTEEKFRYMCILSGCDYLASLHGIGLGKACKLLRLAKEPNILKVIRKIGQYLKMNLVVPEEYVEGFTRANNTFLYQLVFDPVRRKVVPLNPYPAHLDPAELSYAGLNLGDDVGLQMSLGNLDINTLARIDDFNPDKPLAKASKPRSHSWNESPPAAGISIWSGGYEITPEAALPPPAASPEAAASTRGRERVTGLAGLRLPCRELQLKRPREDSAVSDQDVLQQYSTSTLKRPRSDQQPQKLKSPARGQSQPRNRFATLLQKRNQEPEGDDQVTCSSRFFSSAPSVGPDDPAENPPQAAERAAGRSSDSDGPEIPPVETPDPDRSPAATPPGAASRGLKLFDWSNSPSPAEATRTGLSALQLFQYKKDSLSSAEALPSQCDPDDTASAFPPTQDSAYFSQSQPRLPSSSDDEVNSSQHSEPERSPPSPKEEKTHLKPKVSGLSKSRLSRPAVAKKGSALGPARASGLRKKKPPSENNENNPGVQATIFSLWKNYSYKKDIQKLRPCDKRESTSPIKDELQAI